MISKYSCFGYKGEFVECVRLFATLLFPKSSSSCRFGWVGVCPKLHLRDGRLETYKSCHT